MVSIVVHSIDTLPQAAQQFIDHMGDARVFAFYGNMGAGKTTFIKALCECLGVTDTVTSPTFAIVNEYEGHQPVYHFDFYRIRRVEEAYDLGFEEYCYSGHLCFIEWPELIEDLLPEDTVRVTIETLTDGSRRITMN